MLRKIVLCILILSCVLWTTFIFSNSLADAQTSSAQSSSVTETVNKVASSVGIKEEITESTVRNMAHFSEFALLAALVSATVAVAAWQKFSARLALSLLFMSASVPLCFLLACVDELLQKLSEGRASQVTDVLLDTLGAVCGCALLLIGYIALTLLLKHRKIKKQKYISTDE